MTEDINGDEWVSEILQSVDWCEENVDIKEPRVQCRINSHHFLPSSSIVNHEYKCAYKIKGYTESEMNGEKSSKYFYDNAKDVIKLCIPNKTQSEIFGIPEHKLPLTMKRSIAELTPKQRLKMYDYCRAVASSKKSSQLVINDFCNLSDQCQYPQHALTKIELLAMDREVKRRRQSYKNKSVHSHSKNYIEVIREILHNQMEMLSTDWGKSMLNQKL